MPLRALTHDTIRHWCDSVPYLWGVSAEDYSAGTGVSCGVETSVILVVGSVVGRTSIGTSDLGVSSVGSARVAGDTSATVSVAVCVIIGSGVFLRASRVFCFWIRVFLGVLSEGFFSFVAGVASLEAGFFPVFLGFLFSL